MTEMDDKFFAWLDGELSGDEAVAMEARVAADPELMRLAEQHRAMQARLKSAFDTVAETPLPERLQVAVRPPHAEVIDFRAAARARDARRWGSLPQWTAMAATLAVGILVGTAIQPHTNGPVEVQGGRMYAAAALDAALNTQLASTPGGNTRIGLTYRDQSGAICRSFTQPQASGLVCRDDDRWQVRGLFAAPEGQSGSYRMAAGMDPNLAALVDSTMAGDPFDAAQEKAAKQRGWR
jgi:hypothetical protein